MPKSQGRKLPRISNRPKRRPKKNAFYVNGQTKRLKPKVFLRVRDSEDFVAMIRLGRLINALNYANFLMRGKVYEDLSDSQQAIFRLRTIWMSAGFLAEGLNVIDSMRAKYHTDPSFDLCRELFDDKFARHRKLIRDIRHNVSFHLDSDAKFTGQVLKEIKLPYYEFFSRSDTDEMVVTNFHLAELVDINFLGNQSFPDKADAKTIDLAALVLEFSAVCHKATWTAVNGLGEKLSIFPSNTS